MRRLGPLMTAMVKTGNKPTKQETPRYCCELCKKLFSRNYRLVAHMLKFHGIVCAKKKKLVPTPDNPRPHKCDLCEKAFVRRKLLQRHRIAKHISSTCPECNTEIVKLKLKEHMLAAHGKTLQLPYECYLCKHQYKSKLKLQTHMQAIHCDMHQLFRCPLCTEVLTSRDEYRRHRGRHKYDRSKFSKRICEKCGKEVIGSHFRNHERTHLDRSIKCSYCEKRFKYTAAVKLHERTHTQERPYECKVGGDGERPQRATIAFVIFFLFLVCRCVIAASSTDPVCAFTTEAIPAKVRSYVICADGGRNRHRIWLHTIDTSTGIVM